KSGAAGNGAAKSVARVRGCAMGSRSAPGLSPARTDPSAVPSRALQRLESPKLRPAVGPIWRRWLRAFEPDARSELRRRKPWRRLAELALPDWRRAQCSACTEIDLLAHPTQQTKLGNREESLGVYKNAIAIVVQRWTRRARFILALAFFSALTACVPAVGLPVPESTREAPKTSDEKRPVTIEDAIQMTRLADSAYAGGGSTGR